MSVKTYIDHLTDELARITNGYKGLIRQARMIPQETELNPFISRGRESRSLEQKKRYYWHELLPIQMQVYNKLSVDLRIWVVEYSTICNTGGLNYLETSAIVNKIGSQFDFLQSSVDEPYIEKILSKVDATFIECVRRLNDIPVYGVDGWVIVPDTNALIDCSDLTLLGKSISQEDYTIFIPPVVIKELDSLKSSGREKARKSAQTVIRYLRGLQIQGNILEGVSLSDQVKVIMLATEPKFDTMCEWLDPSINDDRLIASTHEIRRNNPFSCITLMTKDLNVHNKALLAGIPTIDTPDCNTE